MRFRYPLLALPSCIVGLGLLVGQASADEKAFTLTIKDHRFGPETLTVPANEKFALVVKNEDVTGEEFESNDFHVEKVIAGGKEMTFHIGPLSAGEYGFFGDRHKESAQGKLFVE